MIQPEHRNTIHPQRIQTTQDNTAVALSADQRTTYTITYAHSTCAKYCNQTKTDSELALQFDASSIIDDYTNTNMATHVALTLHATVLATYYNKHYTDTTLATTSHNPITTTKQHCINILRTTYNIYTYTT